MTTRSKRRDAADAVVAMMKKQVTAEFDSGSQEVVLDVKGLAARDRNRVRHHAHKWYRSNGWIGRTQFDRDTWTQRFWLVKRQDQEEAQPPSGD